MRTVLTLAGTALFASAVPATAQDIVVTQVLQRLCIPVVTARSWEGSTWTAAQSNARALSLTLTDHYDEDDWAGWTYSLSQSTGVYEVEITRSLTSVSCTINPPDTISRQQLEQAANSAAGSGWEVSLNPRGPSWSRRVAGTGGFVSKTMSISIGNTSSDDLQVTVTEVADSPFG